MVLGPGSLPWFTMRTVGLLCDLTVQLLSESLKMRPRRTRRRRFTVDILGKDPASPQLMGFLQKHQSFPAQSLIDVPCNGLKTTPGLF